MNEVIANSALRGSIDQNYKPDTIVKNSPLLFIGPGSVNISGNIVSWPGAYLGYTRNLNQLGQNDIRLFARPFTPGANGALQWSQVYVESSGGGIVIAAVSSSSAAFPVGALPLAMIGVDSGSLIRQIIDSRPMPPL